MHWNGWVKIFSYKISYSEESATEVQPEKEETKPQLIFFQMTVNVWDLNDFEPAIDDPEKWLKRFEATFPNNIKEENKFEYFLKYVSAPIRAWAHYNHDHAKEAPDPRPMELKPEK